MNRPEQKAKMGRPPVNDGETVSTYGLTKDQWYKLRLMAQYNSMSPTALLRDIVGMFLMAEKQDVEEAERFTWTG